MTLVDKYLKKCDVRKAKHSLMTEIPGTTQWRRCHNDYGLMKGSLGLVVTGSDQVGESPDDDDEDNAEDIYDPLRIISWKTVWADYCAVMKVEKREGGDGSRNNNYVDQGYVE